jgi:hypothetical protein
MNPWFLTEGDVIPFTKKDDKVVKLPNVGAYPDFLTGVADLQSRVEQGELSDEMYKKIYTELLHRFMRRESAETPWFIAEASRTPIDQLKAFVQTTVVDAGLKLGSSTRHEKHTRFSFPGELKDYQSFFQPIGISVSERSNISGTFETYNLTTTRPISIDNKTVIPAGTQLPWVNNYTGAGSRSEKTFGDKDLTPDSIGLGGLRITDNEIFLKIKTGIANNTDYAQYSQQFLELAKRSAAKGNTISLSGIDLSKFSDADLKVISKNFGEVLASIWCIRNLDYEKILFPNVSNAKMIDFYGELDGEDYPISVKSGTTGGKVSVVNILEALEDKVKAGKVNPAEQKAYKVFELVRDYGARQQMLELHKYFNTEAIQKLAILIGTPVKKLDPSIVLEWLKKFPNSKAFQKTLLPWHKEIGKGVKAITWERDDERLAAIIGPLAESIKDFLNNNDEIRGSLNQLAQKLSIIQVNVDVKKSLMTFQWNRFENANFYFGYPGYSSGNKLGFHMDTNKK